MSDSLTFSSPFAIRIPAFSLNAVIRGLGEVVPSLVRGASRIAAVPFAFRTMRDVKYLVKARTTDDAARRIRRMEGSYEVFTIPVLASALVQRRVGILELSDRLSEVFDVATELHAWWLEQEGDPELHAQIAGALYGFEWCLADLQRLVSAEGVHAPRVVSGGFVETAREVSLALASGNVAIAAMAAALTIDRTPDGRDVRRDVAEMLVDRFVADVDRFARATARAGA